VIEEIYVIRKGKLVKLLSFCRLPFDKVGQGYVVDG